MGNGSPALHPGLVGTAVILAGITLAFAAPARAETPSPSALPSAPVSPALPAVPAAPAVPAVDAAAATAAPALEPASPTVASAQTTVASGPAAATAPAPAPKLPVFTLRAAVVSPTVQSVIPSTPQQAVSLPKMLVATTRAPREASLRTVATRTGAPRSNRGAGTRLVAIAPRSAAAAPAAAPAPHHEIAQHHAMRTPSVGGNAPIPGRSADANTGAGFGTAPAGQSSQFVGIAPRAFAPVRHDALFRVPNATARFRTHRLLLELERPG